MEAPPVLVAAVDRLLARCGASTGSIRVLDLGGGTGGQAVRLATAGYRVTVVDPSPDALAALDRRSREAGVADTLTAIQGDAEGLGAVVGAGSVDIVLCHGVLEHVDDPALALAQIHTALRPGGGLSLVVAQRHAAVLARAVAGRVREAEAILHGEDGRAGPKDPLRRRFTAHQIQTLLTTAGFDPVSFEREGVGVFTDLVPTAALAEDSGLAAILTELEDTASVLPAYADVAAGLHVVAFRA